MNQLTENEQNFIKKLVDTRKNSRIEELQAARLLRKELTCFALRWELKPKETIKFYYKKDNPSNPNIDWDSLKRNYFQVADFFYFIEELEKKHYIKIQTLPFDVSTDEKILYDRDIYTYNSSDDTFWRKNGRKFSLVPIDAIQNLHIDLVYYLEKYANKIIYPLPLLMDLESHQFKSINQRSFEKQINKTNISLRIAFATLIVSAIIPFVVSKCASPIKIDDNQLKMIEQAIIKNKISSPNSYKIDSLNMKNITTSKKD